MWDEEPGSDFAEQLGKSNNSFESEEDAEDCSPYQEIKSKSIGTR